MQGVKKRRQDLKMSRRYPERYLEVKRFLFSLRCALCYSSAVAHD